MFLLVGTGFQTVRVGIVGTPVGTITLSCAYRTNLAFMSTRCRDSYVPCMFPTFPSVICTSVFNY